MAAWADSPTGGAKNNLFTKDVEVVKMTKTGPFRLIIQDVEQDQLPNKGVFDTMREAKSFAFEFLKNLADAERPRGTASPEDPAARLTAHRTKMLELAIGMLNAFPQALTPTAENIGARVKVTTKIADVFSEYVNGRPSSPSDPSK